jgi:hypothetical protein
MNRPTPIVRQLVLCEHASFSFSTGYTLVNPRLDFTIAEGETFPIWYRELWLFAQLTGSFGRHRFQVVLTEITDPSAEPEVVFATPERSVDLGQSGGPFRRLNRSWAARLRKVPFPRAGRYEISMSFDGEPRGRLELVLEEQS